MPERPTQATGNAGGVETILADRNPCPQAPDCRRKWTHLSGTETAECAFCYQILSRVDMARIFAGSA